MELQNSRTASNIFNISFVIAVFMLLFISSLTYRQIVSLNESEQSVTHTYKVQILLEQLFSFAKDAETGQRGFIITKDSSFLQPYFTARPKIDSIYNQLRVLTGDNSNQQENLDQLKPIINRRFELLANRMNEIGNRQYIIHSDTLRAKMLTEKVVMDMLRQHLNKMIGNESLLLAERQKAHKSELNITPFFSLFLLFFSLLMFIAAYYKITNDVKKLKELNNELILIKESFEHAEKIANISHWEWILESNQLTFSDNQYLLLGFQPNEFEPTIDNYIMHVHPDDRQIVLNGNDSILAKHIASDTVFRVIRKDGELRYFRSTGKMLTDNLGKKTVVGINYDITDQYLASKELEDKNAELIRSNIELASFNYVASHDLQEPLRKIQLFISRIFDDKDLVLSEKSKEYFKRIQLSANRMQVLIDDLLTYSRVNGTDKIFERTDLNEILDAVIEELVQTRTLEEQHTKINISNLPEVDGIPFQLKQLFTNLISNALKYSKPNQLPIIDIHSTIVNAEELKALQPDFSKKYYKISVTDNGMGFEQQYAERIFALFQRLHDKDSFSGTGIGLAICKKVMENHSGFITAISAPNKGTTFIVYLPFSA